MSTPRPDPRDVRHPDHPIESIFIIRWSPRAMSGEPLSDADLNRLFEAARWAPSTYNEQEWRFLYARNGSEHWETFFNLLVEGNQTWCHKASVLLVVLSKKTLTRGGKPNRVHSFDTGAAFENLALQGAAMGLVVHGMVGFDPEKARQDLNIPDDFHVDAMVAIGYPGEVDDLPEGLREKEKPSGRNKIDEFTCDGPFSF